MAHIPSMDTRGFKDISFRSALHAALRPSSEYDTSRWLFVPNSYTEYRYVLGTRGDNPLICIGVNPSTAAPDHLDPTLQSVKRIAMHNGYDSFIMLNVYAQRATSPKLMDLTCHESLHKENLEALRYALKISKSPALWAAWGNIIEVRPYLKCCLEDMIVLAQDYCPQWYYCRRLSKLGHPHHPLYLKKDEPLLPFDIEQYICFLQSQTNMD